MIVDFGLIKQLVGQWIDTNWDHTAILWKADTDRAVAAIAESNQRYCKPVYFMEHPPTAEHIARELAAISDGLLQPHGITVIEVTVWETPSCYATWKRVDCNSTRLGE